jgi:hypothetical protein
VGRNSLMAVVVGRLAAVVSERGLSLRRRNDRRRLHTPAFATEIGVARIMETHFYPMELDDGESERAGWRQEMGAKEQRGALAGVGV